MLRWNHLGGWLRMCAPRRRAERRGRPRPVRIELLEDRTLPSVSFAPPVSYPAGSGPNSVAVADFNADGRPDLAVANENSGSVSVLLGNGDGTFGSQQTFAAGSLPCFVAVGDFNADGKPDLAVANFFGSNVSVLLGNGDGTLQGQQTFGTGGRPLSVAVGDFNADGKPDLAVANSSDATVSVLLGNGDGTFQGQQTFAAGSGPYSPFSVAVGDFNTDGKPDLALANYISNNVSVLLGNGDGTFQGQQTFAVGSGPYSVAVGDFNADGKPDLAVANYTSNYVSVLLSNGDGTFQGQRTFATNSGTHNSVAAGDFDGDGTLDLAVDNSGNDTISVLLGNGDGTFQGQESYATGRVPESVAVGDFNGDGALDLATADFISNGASVLLNRAPRVTVVDAGGTYNGSPFPATASNVGLDGVTPVSGSYTFTYTNTATNSASSAAPVNAGTYTVVAHFTSSDPIYRDNDSAPTSFTIGQVPLTGSITAASKPYDGTVKATITSHTLTGVLPADVGNVSYVGGTATFADPDVGAGKTVTATGLSLAGTAAGNYTVNTTAITTADIIAAQAPTDTALTVSLASPLAGVDAVDLTASVTSNAAGNLTGSVGFFDTSTGQALGTAPVVNGVATIHVGAFTPGAHALTATYSGDANFVGSTEAAALTALAPASLSGVVFRDLDDDSEVDFGEQGIGGVSINLTGTDDRGQAVSLSQATDGDGAYVFGNLRPGSYYLTEVGQPSGTTQGTDSIGTAGGQLSAVDQFYVQLAQGVNGLNYNYGERPEASGGIQQGQTAGIGFWNNRHGQALILAFNGGTGHQLGDWLTATLVNLFGAGSANNLAGKDNAYIAALFQEDFRKKGEKLDAQVLATALSVYATNATLDDTRVAAQYGFRVEGAGVGTATFNVGTNGAAFGVADGTTMTVLELLLAADARAVNGVLYNGNANLRHKANDVFSAINQAGEGR